MTSNSESSGSDASKAVRAAGGGASRRKRRLLLVVPGVLLIVLVVAILLAPVIASSMAPGIIESSAAESISGKVRVKSVSLGYFSPARVEQAELLDDKGELVGRASVGTTFTLLDVLGGRWWSADAIDLGKVTLSGDVNLVQELDGSTNLQRALAPRSGAAGGTGTSGGAGAKGGAGTSASGGKSIKIVLAMAGVSVTRQERTAGGLSARAGVEKLAGEIAVTLDTRSGMQMTAKGALAGAPVGGAPGTTGGPGPSTTPVKIDVDASVRQRAATGAGSSALASLEDAKVELKIEAAPVALIDAFARMGGGLLEAVGPTADARVSLNGTLAALKGSLQVTSAGLAVRLPMEISAGVVRSRPGMLAVPSSGASVGAGPTLSLRSIEGLGSIPALRQLNERLREQVRLTTWPQVELVTEEIALPSPVDAQGTPRDLGSADFRASSARVRVRISAMAGTVLTPGSGTGAAGSADGGAWKPFSTEPMELVIDAPDLAGPVRVSARTRAMLDGQPAGELVLQATGEGLLDAQGHLRALSAGAAGRSGGSGSVSGDLISNVQVHVGVSGLASSLIAPIVAGFGLPVDVSTDVGPSLSVEVHARTASPMAAATTAVQANALAGLPPVELDARIESVNIKLQGALRLEQGVLTSASSATQTPGTGIVARVATASGLARRILESDGQSPALLLGGKGAVEADVTNLRVDLNQLVGSTAAPSTPAGGAGGGSGIGQPNLLKAVRADVRVALADLSARLPAPQGSAGSTSGGDPVPIDLSRVQVDLHVSPGESPTLKLKGSMACQGDAFSLDADLDFAGLAAGDLSRVTRADAGPITKALALEPTGTIALSELPLSLMKALPASASGSSDGASGGGVQGASDPVAMARDLVGRWASVSLKIVPDASGATGNAPTAGAGGAPSRTARLLVETQSKAVGLSVVTRLEPSVLTVVSGSVFAKAEPAQVNPILAKLSASAEGSAAARPMTLSSPATIWARVGGAEPVKIPLKDMQPDLAGMSPLRLTLESQGDLGISGIALGGAGAAGSGGSGGSDGTGAPRTIDVRLVGLLGQVDVPAGALSKAPTRPAIHAALGTKVVRADGAPIATLGVTADISGNRSNGTTTDAQVTLEQLSTATLDQSLALDGLLQGFVGDTAKVVVRTQIASSGMKAPAEAGTGSGTSTGGAPSGAASSLSLSASIEAPRINGASIRLQRDADRLAITDAATITIRPDAAFLNSLTGADKLPPAQGNRGSSAGQGSGDSLRTTGEEIGRQLDGLFGSKKSSAGAGAETTGAGAAGGATRMRLVDADQIVLKISKLAIASAGRDGLDGPFKPGVFELDVAFDTPKLAIETLQVAADGSASYNSTIARFQGLRGSVKSVPPPAANPAEGSGVAVAFDIDRVTTEEPAPEAGAAGAGAKAPEAAGRASSIRASVRRLSDARGVMTKDRAIVNAEADISGFPTIVIDRLANQGGLLAEVLGPSVSLKAQAQEVSLPAPASASAAAPGARTGSSTQAGAGGPARASSPAGLVKATMTSSRATAQVAGDLRNGQFVQTGPMRVEISEIRPRLVQMLAGSIPVVASLEKSRGDKPAVIEMTNLRAPMDGDLSKLDGTISVDLGVARFTTSSAFGQILKAAGGKEQGTIGRKIEPFLVQARAGVLDYERFTLPLGEFDLQTKGQVDLVNRQIRVTTYAPFFAIAEEALGPVKLGLGKVDLINRNTLVPITTKGSLDNPKTSLDTEEFLKSLGKGLIEQPGKAIGDVLEDVLGGKKKDKQKDKK